MASGGSKQEEGLRRSLGIDGYLLKPLIQDELHDTIGRALNVSKPEAIPPAPAEPDAISPIRRLSILIAEDAAINQKLIGRILEKQGHSITIANNGEEALRLRRHAAYDLIFMDIEMPVMDGYSATAALRAMEQEQGGHVPIVAMTAHVLPGDADKCLAAGMDAYISKPFRNSDVQAVISRLTTHTEFHPAG
jgi:CheY-like chemotaxis protein